MKTGTIKAIEAPFGSGGLTIILEDGTRLFGDNAVTIRSLDCIFGDIIQGGHSFNSDKLIGKKIKYQIDEYGIMDGIVIAE